MDVDVDHYNVLGLPSGEEGARLSQQQINKAYRLKAMVLHPDKRLDDPDAHAEFVKPQTSYLVLKDEKARKLFDDLLRVKREKLHLQVRQDSKRQKMMSELEKRERSALVVDTRLESQTEEERIIFQQLKEEIDSISAMHAKKKAPGIAHFEKAGMENKEGGRHVHGLPRQPASTPSGFVAGRNEPSGPKSSNLVGADFRHLKNQCWIN